MLQAILHNKFGKAISNGSFKSIEDTLTSSVFGLMQYLPDDLFWHIIKGSCGQLSVGLPESIGVVRDFHFWERFDATGTYNDRDVEPDVWVVTDKYDIIIEAKRSDNSADNSQYDIQWENQIISLRNSYGDEKPKPIIYIAIGGNDSLRDTSKLIDGKEFIIHTASWYNLLNTVLHLLQELEFEDKSYHTKRILIDIIQALQLHGVIKTVWFDNLSKESILGEIISSLKELWDFDNEAILEDLLPLRITNEIDIQNIWTVAK